VEFIRGKNRRQVQSQPETNASSEHLVTVLRPTSAASETFRTLRTNLLYSFADNPPKFITVTSPGVKEGKSIVCANLGVVLAEAEKSTLVLDCDFRKPKLHKFFGLRNLRGIVDVLVQEDKLQDVWEETMPRLKVASVGSVPPNPAELLTSQRLSEVFANLRKEFEYVLVDTPPVGLFSDAAILATQADGVLLAFDARTTRKVAVRRAIGSLETVGAKVLGTVMNNIEVPEGDYYYNYLDE
jgi:capsular exopolysaccharide synthesis family protein